MIDRRSYARFVLVLTVVFCALAALGYWVAPGVRAGAVPAIGGIVWHALGVVQLLLANVYGPVAARVAEATSPRLGVATLLAMTAGSALLLAMAIGLPFFLMGRQSNQPQPLSVSE
jgi:hypothetical protein